MNVRLLLLAILFITTGSCEKSEETPSYGVVIFYTNAQYLLNCGEFDVKVQIDDSIAGKLRKPFLPIDSIPSCESTDTLSVLKLKREIGVYNYSADFYCSSQMQWNGIFEIKRDSCTIIFFDLNQF